MGGPGIEPGDRYDLRCLVLGETMNPGDMWSVVCRPIRPKRRWACTHPRYVMYHAAGTGCKQAPDGSSGLIFRPRRHHSVRIGEYIKLTFKLLKNDSADYSATTRFSPLSLTTSNPAILLAAIGLTS